MNIPFVITRELGLRQQQITEVIILLEEGATIPFIARYRKERTDGLEEDVLRQIEEKLAYYKMLDERRQTILKSIEEQGKLTDELRAKIEECTKLNELEDLYLPYKPKRKTRGSIAKAKGLEPLALFILETPDFSGDIKEKAAEFISEELGVKSAAEALQGAKDIIAEMISDNADVRKAVREYLSESSHVESAKANTEELETQNLKLKEKEKKEVYLIYFEFKQEITKLKPYQILAMNRGEKEGFLRVKITADEIILHNIIRKKFPEYEESVFNDLIMEVIADAYGRLIFPSVEREIRNMLSELADLHAIEIFAGNLRQLLLQPPFSDKIIMGIDPGYVSGCKVAVIDRTGKYLEGATIYPHEPKNRMAESEASIIHMIKKYRVNVVAIGNGTASRETEVLVAGIIKNNSLECSYLIVNEAGASVYSASETAKKEFPDLEASQRGNISIARRVHDPLAELVKIDPKSIGVGLYQHDVDQRLLSKKLDDVVESCVNYVGVDVNTASASLLTYVSGLNKRTAENIVKHREKKGGFKKRGDLLEVTGLGEKAFEQSAGFLRIPNGENPFDNTFIHPETYDATDKLLSMFSIGKEKLKEAGPLLDFYISKKGLQKTAKELGVGEPTLKDIIENLKKPGRDPREDMPKPILRSDVLKMEDLKEDMKLKGTVRNVVDFGAFVDIGVKQDALLHISEIADKFIKNPSEVLSVGDIIDVRIISLDITRKRISVSMKEKK